MRTAIATRRGILCPICGEDQWRSKGIGEGWCCLPCERDMGAKQRYELRMEAIAVYGGRCICCGEDEPRFLTIDHMLGGGAEHRRQIGEGNLYRYLKDAGWPSDNYRLLCWNCNCGRANNGGVCPHERRLSFGSETETGLEASLPALTKPDQSARKDGASGSGTPGALAGYERFDASDTTHQPDEGEAHPVSECETRGCVKLKLKPLPERRLTSKEIFD